MTPKEKAEELYYKFCEIKWDEWFGEFSDDEQTVSPNKVAAKKMCLIAVEEIVNEQSNYGNNLSEMMRKDYWQLVKTEIEKL